MADLTLSEFQNFFKFYKETPQQKLAIRVFYEALHAENTAQLADSSRWIYEFRKPEPKPTPAQWLVSKAQLGKIMKCSVEYLPDALMQDLDNALRRFGIIDNAEIAYFLGQCGAESAGLRYPLEIASGDDYEGRTDLGNTISGDGRRFKGAGFIQVTGRYWHTDFSNWMKANGNPDPKILAEGSSYTGNKYPWTISAFWWFKNDMINYCKTGPSIDRVGQRVNGAYPPNGAQDRRDYTNRAFDVFGLP